MSDYGEVFGFAEGLLAGQDRLTAGEVTSLRMGLELSTALQALTERVEKLASRNDSLNQAYTSHLREYHDAKSRPSKSDLIEKYINRIKTERWEVQGGYSGEGMENILSEFYDEVSSY